jgi:hypothetical protein
LRAVNSVKPFNGQNIIHAPFAPLHHVRQAWRKVYFFLSKEVSYDSLRKSWAFQPAGLRHTNTPRLPLSYTIVPINEWNSFAPATISAGSLVRIHAAGLYRNALGYVIGASTNQANECALVAVLPKVEYPNIPLFAENERDSNPPPKKRNKIESPSHHPQLFDPTRLRIRKQRHALRQSRDLYTTIYEDGFQRFFKNKFPDIQSNGETHMFDLDGFTWLVRQREGDTVVTEQSSMEIIPKTPPLYHYRGHLYYLGMRILPIYQRSSITVNHRFEIDEVLPFVEARLASDVFDPLFSQMHWKRGDKLVDAVQSTEYPFYRIHRVNLEEGVVVAHLVLTREDKEDAQELKSSGIPVDVNRLPHEYTLSALRLRLVVGDHVKVIAGAHKGTCGVIVDLLVEERYVRIIPYGGENDQNVS